MAPRRRWLLGKLGAALLIGVLVAGCSWDAEEPGLFGSRTEPTDSLSEGPARDWPVVQDMSRRTNPELPVVGERTWTSGDGIQLTVRIAVHAVRRVEGATVLDWSITPLGAPGLGPNDIVPANVDLGLHRFDEGNTNVFLVDARRGRLYRPLVHRNISRRCLCVPIWLAQRNLQIGRTSLLQVAYPVLPRETTAVDVDVATVAMISQVPVTPRGMVPLALGPTDLTRAPMARPGPAAVPPFSYPDRSGQRFQLAVDRVIASDTNTSVRWTIRSLDAGPGLEEANGPPFADPASPITYNTIAASGPQLRVGKRVLRARLVSSALTSSRTVECLCSDLRIWARSLRSPGQQVSVVTNLPGLPKDASEVTVVLPGFGERRVPVVRTGPAYLRSTGPQTRDVGVWRPRDWPRGWNSQNWPTAVPDPRQLDDYLAVTDRILR